MNTQELIDDTKLAYQITSHRLLSQMQKHYFNYIELERAKDLVNDLRGFRIKNISNYQNAYNSLEEAFELIPKATQLLTIRPHNDNSIYHVGDHVPASNNQSDMVLYDVFAIQTRQCDDLLANYYFKQGLLDFPYLALAKNQLYDLIYVLPTKENKNA